MKGAMMVSRAQGATMVVVRYFYFVQLTLHKKDLKVFFANLSCKQNM
jgi:hypothetical protein